MKHIALTDEQYEQLLDELNSLTSYHLNDDTVHSDNCGSKVLSAIEAGATTSLLTKQELEVVRCMFEEWHAGNMPLRGDTTYVDAIDALCKLGFDEQGYLVEKFCKEPENSDWEQLSDYHGDDRYDLSSRRGSPEAL